MCILPTFTKCCFCFPLRKGVQCYGHIHLFLCALGTAYIIGSGLLLHPVALCVVLLTIESLFLIILIIACHKKNIGLLKAPFVYNKVMWVLYVVLGLIVVIRLIFMYKEAIATNNGLLLVIVFDIGVYILPGLICNICLRSYVILWIKGLMMELKEQSPSLDIASHNSPLLEVTVEENEAIVEIETDGDTVQLEDKDKEANTRNGVELQINEDEVETIDVKSNANPIEVHGFKLRKDNEQYIKLQVLNSNSRNSVFS